MKSEEEIIKKIEEVKNIVAEMSSPNSNIESSIFVLGFYSGFLSALSWVVSKDDFMEVKIDGRGEKTRSI